MKKTLFLCLIVLISVTINAQSTTKLDRPKLVVGIVIDQMRYDYLTRFYNKYSDGGFKRLMKDGFTCENAHLNYMPTHTAVGHATIYTGTTPDTHGIIGNNWYDKFLKKSVYCVDDFNVKAVGTKKENEQKSPNKLMVNTLTDALRLSQSMKSKTISVSIKDRSAVLPGGHTSNGSYWYVGKDEGKFITSTYYMDKLPKWVKEFNELKLPKKYVKQKWETLYPIDTYTESIADDNSYEGLFKGKKTSTFPYDLAKLRKKNNNFDLVKSTPYGNEIIIEFAKAAIKNEHLGKGEYTDFLAISFSSTDYIGHQFGVDSKEVEDAFLRLDIEIAKLLNYLDDKIGIENYILFLTADHGAYQVPAYLMSQKIPGEKLNSDDFKSFLMKISDRYFNSNKIIENFSNYQIFLNKEEILRLNLNKNKVTQILADEIINYKGVHKVVTAHTLQNTNFTSDILEKLQNGYNQKLSGDVFIIPNPVNITYSNTGSGHGSGYSFDTHVPVIFYGKGVKKGKSKKYIPIINIAPTIANLLQIEFSSGNKGTIIAEAIK